MNNSQPLISIIITTHNCELNIESSINSAINQSYKNIEIIIVDDNSIDKTLNICEKYKYFPKFKLVKNNFNDKQRFYKGVNINAGYYSKNLGIHYSSGEWISFLDGGDILNPSKLEIQLQAAKKFKCKHILTGYERFDSNKKFTRKLEKFNTNLDDINIISTNELLKLLKNQNDLMSFLPSVIRKNFPLYFRQSYKLRKIIYPEPMNNFPACGESVFMHKSIKTRFRSLKERRWSSAKGRGGDRDFNFQILETYKSSIVVDLPLVYWGV